MWMENIFENQAAGMTGFLVFLVNMKKDDRRENYGKGTEWKAVSDPGTCGDHSGWKRPLGQVAPDAEEYGTFSASQGGGADM